MRIEKEDFDRRLKAKEQVKDMRSQQFQEEYKKYLDWRQLYNEQRQQRQQQQQQQQYLQRQNKSQQLSERAYKIYFRKQCQQKKEKQKAARQVKVQNKKHVARQIKALTKYTLSRKKITHLLTYGPPPAVLAYIMNTKLSLKTWRDDQLFQLSQLAQSCLPLMLPTSYSALQHVQALLDHYRRCNALFRTQHAEVLNCITSMQHVAIVPNLHAIQHNTTILQRCVYDALVWCVNKINHLQQVHYHTMGQALLTMPQYVEYQLLYQQFATLHTDLAEHHPPPQPQ